MRIGTTAKNIFIMTIARTNKRQRAASSGVEEYAGAYRRTALHAGAWKIDEFGYSVEYSVDYSVDTAALVRLQTSRDGGEP
jgi:hypothetical protein